MEKIWTDRHWLRYVIFLGSISLLSIGIKVFFIEYSPENISKIILILFISIVFSFGIVNLIRIKLTYITIDGMRIGNAPDDMYSNLRLKSKPKFLQWRNIKEIKIIGRVIIKSGFSDKIDLLILTTKDSKKYETFIANPLGFVKTIKNLKKEHLFSKDSKYLEMIKEK